MKNIDRIRKKLTPERRAKIKARAAEIVAEEMSLRELRQAHRKTQAVLAKELGITQDGVSRLEKRSDLLLSTLQKYVRRLGGHLTLVAKFPNRPAVVLKGVGTLENDKPAKRA